MWQDPSTSGYQVSEDRTTRILRKHMLLAYIKPDVCRKAGRMSTFYDTGTIDRAHLRWRWSVRTEVLWHNAPKFGRSLTGISVGMGGRSNKERSSSDPPVIAFLPPLLPSRLATHQKLPT